MHNTLLYRISSYVLCGVHSLDISHGGSKRGSNCKIIYYKGEVMYTRADTGKKDRRGGGGGGGGGG